MISYKEFTRRFGASLFDAEFQAFLTNTFSDLTEYNILESDYITSNETGLEIGFTNNDAEYDEDDKVIFRKGNPIFSHFVAYPKSAKLIGEFPFETTFTDTRDKIIAKAGNPTRTNEGFADFLDRKYLVDNYKVDDIVISFDYNAEDETINFIQMRENNLTEHLKL
jgi:hypothetical protein